MNCTKNALAAAIAATIGGTGTAADAAEHVVVLTGVASWSNSGSSAADLTSSTATFSYDDVTNLVTQTGGIFNQRVSIVPNVVTLFRHTITGLVIGNGAVATAATYVCTNGNFGDVTGASLCGNYNFGNNFVDESTATWGPGTSFAKTIGGDDMNVGPQQNVSQLDGMNSAGIIGTTLVLSNARQGPGTGPPPNIGYDWTFTTDVDADGIENSQDNCMRAANPTQCDSDGDNYGNRCDGDLNNNTATNAQDYVLFRAQLGQPSVAPVYNQADFNCDTTVNSQDYVLFRQLLGKPSGPSGLVP